MNLLVSAIMLVTPVAEARNCKFTRNDTVILYGECSSEKGITVFKSCAGFYCQLPAGREDALLKGEKGCSSKEDILKESLKEHNKENIKDIPFCKNT